jgi:GT2 family glycosyltransferase
MRPFVSIVVPSYNRRSSLIELLSVLQDQDYPRDQFEVIVVDDGSNDGTVASLRDLSTELTLRIVEETHRGPAEARNTGVSEARGEVVVFVDDDVRPVPSLISEHVRARGGDLKAVVIGPMLPPEDWHRPVWIRWVEQTLLRQYGAMARGEWSCSPRQFYTANASVSRSLFLRVGGFDASFKRAEDVELALRLRNAGAWFIFAENAAVIHYPLHTYDAWCRATYQYGRYDVIMTRDKGLESFKDACREYHRRHQFGRRLTRLTVGRRPAVSAVVRGGGLLARLLDRGGLGRVSMQVLSAVSIVLYWQGARDELASTSLLWDQVTRYRH